MFDLLGLRFKNKQIERWVKMGVITLNLVCAWHWLL